MSKLVGHLSKMKVRLATPVEYYFRLDDNEFLLNDYLGKKIKLTYKQQIDCLYCKKPTKKSYSQGYCFLCSKRLARCDFCIMKPETCHYHKGTCREPNWGIENCFIEHYVYIANSSSLKVGITRHTQIPTRWIDQGAVSAIPMFKVKSRRQAGILEVLLKEHISDKTNWRKMLQNDVEEIDLIKERAELYSLVNNQVDKLNLEFDNNITLTLDFEPTLINYPVLEYPTKIKSFNLDKDPSVEGVLQGIKGQYLILDTGVINIRKYTSYIIEFDLI